VPGAVRVGDRLPPLERRIRLVDMVAYAGATWDWHRLHYDRDHVEELGVPRPVVDGQALGAYLAEQVLDWLGPRAFLRRMGFRLAAMVLADESIRVEGEVVRVDRDADGTLIAVDQRILVGDRVAVERATTEAVVPGVRSPNRGAERGGREEGPP
jgi:acyl dehydratase